MEYQLRPDILYMARHPALYRGDRRRHNYFEGWYYNIKSEAGETLVFIPGISRDENGDGHAFIQIIDEGVSHNINYNLSEFSFEDNPFSISIADNKFTLFSANIDIKGDRRYQGELYFRNVIKLRGTRYAPSIMGPFAYLPFMQCNHGILCMNAHVKGKIDTGKKEMDFDNGSVYIEKDWGTSFPEKYVWVQCNRFEDRKTRLSLSIADVPFLGTKFCGIIAVLQRGSRQNVFASYYFAHIRRLEINKEEAEIEIKQGKYTLKVKVFSRDRIKLLAPIKGRMVDNVYESITSCISIQLFYKNKLAYQTKGCDAGYEYKGFN